MVSLFPGIRGIDGVRNHRPCRGLGDQLFQPGPGLQPRLHTGGIERLCRKLIEVGCDIRPACLGERGRRLRKTHNGHTHSFIIVELNSLKGSLIHEPVGAPASALPCR
jgi:hypothetical protein